MIKIAVSGDLALYEVSKDQGVLVNEKTGYRKEGKIISLLSASDEWQEVDNQIRKTSGVAEMAGPPPGPPPREGLKWEATSHRWVSEIDEQPGKETVLYPGRATRPCTLYTHSASKAIVDHVQKVLATIPAAAKGNIQEIALNQRLGKSDKTGMRVAGRFIESNHRIFIAKQPDYMASLVGSFLCHESGHALLTDVIDILKAEEADDELYSAFVKFDRAAKKYGPISEYAGQFKGNNYIHENFADTAEGMWSADPSDRDWIKSTNPEICKAFEHLVDVYSRGIGK